MFDGLSKHHLNALLLTLKKLSFTLWSDAKFTAYFCHHNRQTTVQALVQPSHKWMHWLNCQVITIANENFSNTINIIESYF